VTEAPDTGLFACGVIEKKSIAPYAVTSRRVSQSAIAAAAKQAADIPAR
jgi:hypothetical protein